MCYTFFMGKYSSIIIGSCVAVLGLLGVIVWRSDFLAIIKGSIPVILVFGGVIAVIAGLTELKDEAGSQSKK